MGKIAYKRGVMLAAGAEGALGPEAACQVVRYEHGILLVRIEEEADFLRVGIPVQLEVPAEQSALFRVDGKVKDIVSASDGTPIVLMEVDRYEMIQRRKQERYDVSYPCRFVVQNETRRPAVGDSQAEGAGKLTDISLGGAELETEMKLSRGSTIQLNVRVPSGHLDFTGQVVKVITRPTGPHRYGIQITSIDNFSWHLLNRLVLQLERRERRRRQMDAIGSSVRTQAPRRSLRESRRRWER